MHFKNRFKVYLKYTSLLISWSTQSILETCKFKLFFCVTNFGNKNISKSILEVYFIFRVYTEVYLKYSSISAGQNTNKSLHNLRSNGLVVRVQVYQTKDPRFKTIKWLKNCLSCQSNYIHKVVHWDKWTVKRHHDFLVKYTSEVQLKYP